MADDSTGPLDPSPAPPLETGAANPTRRPPVRRVSTGNDWTPEDEERYQAQRAREVARNRTRRRQGWSFFAIVAVVILIGLLGAAINQGVVTWPLGGSATEAVPCPVSDAPAKPAEVSVKVLNGSGKKGLAATVSKELAARGYSIAAVGNAPDAARDFPDTAHIVHGASGVQAAKSVQAQVPGAVLVADDRSEGTVDLLLGTAYTALAAPEAAAEALTAAPVQSPSGCIPPTP